MWLCSTVCIHCGLVSCSIKMVTVGVVCSLSGGCVHVEIICPTALCRAGLAAAVMTGALHAGGMGCVRSFLALGSVADAS